MRDKYKLVVGSLVGAVAIHVIFVACGNNGGTGANGMGEAGAEGGMLDALMDQIGSMIDGTTKDARADTDSGNDAGTCGCTVSLSGPIQNTPASENSMQLGRGNIGSLTAAGTIVVTGPFVLTDAIAAPMSGGGSIGALLVLQPMAASCTPLAGAAENEPGYLGAVGVGGPVYNAIHGGRYLVPAGQMLCAFLPYPTVVNPTWEGELQWAGFKPYQ